MKNTDQAYIKLMKLKFNMHVLRIEDDLYGYPKKTCFHFVRKKYLVFQPAEKIPWFSGRIKQIDGLTPQKTSPHPQKMVCLTGIIPKSLPVLSTESILCKMAVDREYGFRSLMLVDRDNILLSMDSVPHPSLSDLHIFSLKKYPMYASV